MKRSIAATSGAFLGGHQGEGVAFGLGAAGAADAVHVVVGMLRHVVVDDVRDGGNIDAARGDVGRDHDLVLAGAETFQRLGPLAHASGRSAWWRPCGRPIRAARRCGRR